MKDLRPARQLAGRIGMVPRDTNGQGTISGGVLLCHIDLAAAVVARSACANLRVTRMVTRAMDQVEFTRPVLVDDILTCYGTVTRVGKTSVTVKVDVEVEREGEILPVTQATAVFVALDEQGKPTPVCGNKQQHHEHFPATTTVSAPKTVPPSPMPLRGERVVALRKYMLPAETNGMGNIFGGLLLTYMDMAGHYTARQACKNRVITRCVTRLMDKIEFKEPVHVNDIITCYGTITKVGRTSITVHIDVEAERQGETIQVTQADLVFVAVDTGGRPVPVCSSGQPIRQPRTRKEANFIVGALIVYLLASSLMCFLGSTPGLICVAGGFLATAATWLWRRRVAQNRQDAEKSDSGQSDDGCGCAKNQG